jgi:citrate synthase
MSRSGLEDVVAVTTRIGRVDGARGELVVRGHRIEAVAHDWRYEDAMQRLWAPELGTSPSHEDLSAARVEVYTTLRQLGLFEDSFAGGDPMDYLRRCVSMLAPAEDPGTNAVRAAAALGVAGPAWWRLRNGQSVEPPSPNHRQAEDILAMLTGSAPDGARVRALDTYLVTVVDHGMNASTFTARVIASTHADLLSSVAGALGALKGPLHGGAPGPVLDMLDAIGAGDRAESWLRAELEEGRRIMGMGHRVYRVRDPRAAVFEEALERLQVEESSERVRLARAVEEAAEAVLAERYPDRALKANVEFYTAVLLEAVGIPRELFTPTFAVGRVLGWCAHAMEHRREGRLIRPRAAYAGSLPSSGPV